MFIERVTHILAKHCQHYQTKQTHANATNKPMSQKKKMGLLVRSCLQKAM